MTRVSDSRGTTVTFLFTDIEGSTRLLHHLGDEGYANVLAVHHHLLHASIAGTGGRVLQDHGDGLLAIFDRALDGVLAAVSAQRALAQHPWPEKAEVRVRMALHTGEPVIADAGYVGLDVHRTARICQAAWGGQILSSQTTRDLLEDARLDGIAFRDLGEHRLKDLARSQRLFQVVAADLPDQFPRPRSLDVLPNNLPAQVKALSPEQIARRLDDRFHLLTGGARLDVPHHQTLQAAIGWSYDSLSELEQIVFRRLAVFAGGFTLEAAEAVGSGAGVDTREVLDLVARLADKSLIVVEEHEGEARYRMLETIREYAATRLRASDEAGPVRTRHLEFFEALARDAYNFTEAQRRAWLNRLEVEHDNLRAALRWSQETGELVPTAAQNGLRLAISMARFWEVRGFLREGREHLEALLSLLANTSRSAERARALNWLGRLALFQNDYGPARAACEEAVALFRTLGDRFGLARTLRNLGPIALSEGAYERARALYEEDLRLSRERGDEHEIAIGMSNLGLVARCQGQYDLARTVLEESLERFDRLGISQAYSLIHLGVVHYCQDNFAEASRILKAGLTLFAANKNRRLVAESFVYLAGVAAALGQPRRAAMLCGAAETLYGDVGATVWPVNRAIYDRALADARQRLGERGYEEAWAIGREMTLEPGVAYALGEGESPALDTTHEVKR